LFLSTCNETTRSKESNQPEKIIINSVSKTINNQPEKINEIPVYTGFTRIISPKHSFAEYLQNLKLKKDKTVYAYDGSVIMNKDNGYQYAVIDMDVGNRDLQQCADAIMRLRAEYLYSLKKYNQIHFNFSDGKARYYTNYSKSDYSYKKFRKYMNYIFAYANTATLKRELHKVKVEDMQIGDVFIQQGSPYGHAVIVVDMAENPNTGEKIFMVAQSFMPAQSIHILKNTNKNDSPWYPLNFGEKLRLPSWTFNKNDLRRF
jgi:hypothetical protein